MSAENTLSTELTPPYASAPPLDEYVEHGRLHPLAEQQPLSLTRRAFLGVGLAAVALSADQYIGDLMAGGGDPKVMPFNTRNADVFPATAALIFGGFNVAHPERIAAALEPTLEDYGQIYYMRYSPFGLNKSGQIAALSAWKKQTGIRNVRLYGHSMGGMVATELVGPLQDDVGLNVEMVNLDCTPQTVGDVRGTVEQLMVKVLAAADEANFHGGPVTRLTLESIADYHAHFGKENVVEAVKHSLRKLVPGNASNQLVQSQAYTIAHFNSTAHAPYLRHKPVSFFRPRYAWRDSVVNDDTAQAGWETDLPHLICEARFETHHADPSDYPQAYNEMLRATYQKAGFSTAEQVRLARHFGPHHPI